MVGFWIKLVIFPLGILFSNYVFGLHYTLTHAMIVSIVLIVDDQIMEIFFLRERTLWLSTFLDSVSVFLIIYFSQYLLPGVTISIWAALGTTLLFSIIEYFQHAYLVSSGHAKHAGE